MQERSGPSKQKCRLSQNENRKNRQGDRRSEKSSSPNSTKDIRNVIKNVTRDVDWRIPRHTESKTQSHLPSNSSRKRIIIQHHKNRREGTQNGRSHGRTLRQGSLGRWTTKLPLDKTRQSLCDRFSSAISNEIKQRKSRCQSLEAH